MGALGTIEQVERSLLVFRGSGSDLLGGGVGVGVGNFGGFAEGAYAHALPGGEEHCGRGGDKHVARWELISLLIGYWNVQSQA